MPAAEAPSAVSHVVVVNDEGQYSVWPSDRPRPAGWDDGGFSGGYDACLDFIERTWVDMRPVSAR